MIRRQPGAAPADTTATCKVEVAVRADGSGGWVAHGTAGGVPFVAEGDSEEGAMAEAAALVFESHARRRLAALLERGRRTPSHQRGGKP